MNKNIHTFLGMESEYADASMVVFGVPFDGTTSYRPGTRFAPQVMRAEFVGLETYSPLLDKDLEDFLIFDGGDLELPFGNVEAALNTIKAYTQNILADDKKPLMIGGEHLVSLPTIQAVYEKYPDLRVIHLDAHTDLREHYLDQPLSHASVMRRVWDFLGDGKIFQFGIRSGTKA
ncbi:MAG: agmatinase, partial [Hyphomonadaceae bacterium]|nr:agmatinase [Clostridia bacterium]